MAPGGARPRVSRPGGGALTVAALAAARIPPERCGRARTQRLDDRQSELYRWVLRSFAEKGRPSAAEVHERARALGLDPDETEAVLAREDLVHLGPDGEIVVAYPFSGRPTRHRVLLPGDREVWSMCAIDALGTAAMLGTPIDVRSTDPIGGEPIGVVVEPGREPQWHPSGAVVLAGSACDGPSYAGCCDVLNFFASRANAERYLAGHPHVQGHAITIPEALAAGDAIFADVLRARA